MRLLLAIVLLGWASTASAYAPAIESLARKLMGTLPEGAGVEMEPFLIRKDSIDIGKVSPMAEFVSEELFRLLKDEHKIDKGNDYRVSGSLIRIAAGYQLDVQLTDLQKNKGAANFKPLTVLEEKDILVTKTEDRNKKEVKESMSTVAAIAGPTADYSVPEGLTDKDGYLEESFRSSLDDVESDTVTYEFNDGYLSPLNSQFGVQILSRKSPNDFWQPVQIQSQNGEPFIDVQAGDRLSVKIINRREPNPPGSKKNTVGAMIIVDGQTSLAFSREWKPNLLFNVHPQKPRHIEGWHIEGPVHKEFLVSNRLDSQVAEQGKDFGGLTGMIQIQIFNQFVGKSMVIDKGKDIESSMWKKTDMKFEDHPTAVISVRFTHPE